MTMLPAKIIIQLLLIILFSFIIILNTIHLLPTSQEVAWIQVEVKTPVLLESVEVETPVDFKTPSHVDIDEIVETLQTNSSNSIEITSCISSCLLHLENLSLPQETGSAQSLCGHTASRRGNHQKVVACSFYGGMKHGYFQGITENLNLMQERKGCSNIKMLSNQAQSLGLLPRLGVQTLHRLCQDGAQDQAVIVFC
jgi:hypothetical protein